MNPNRGTLTSKGNNMAMTGDEYQDMIVTLHTLHLPPRKHEDEADLIWDGLMDWAGWITVSA